MSKQKYILLAVAVVVLGGLGGLWWKSSKANNVTDANTVHLTNYTDNDGPKSSIVLSGAIGDYGQATRNDTNGTATLSLGLTRGTLQLDVTTLEKNFSAAVGKAKFNQATCSGEVGVRGPASIIKNSGTGAYKNAHGTFALTMSLDEVVPKASSCSANDIMLGQAIVTSGWGKVSFE